MAHSGSRPPTAHPPLAQSLLRYTGFLLRRAYVLAVDTGREAIPTPHHIRDAAILSMLDDLGPLSQSDLCGLSLVNPTVMVKLVDGLEDRGLVTRTRNPKDRRSYALTPTKRGWEALARLAPALADADSRLTARLTRAERDRLVTLLRRLVESAGEPLVDSLAGQAGYLVALAHKHLMGRAATALEPLGIEPRHFGLLATLHDEQPCSQRWLADRLGITPPAVLAFVDDLDDAHLVERRRNPEDRRAYDLRLTPAGEETLARARRAAATVQREVADTLGADADRELRELLAKLIGVASGDGRAATS